MTKVLRADIARIIADTTLKQGVSKNYAREIAGYLLESQRTGELDSLLRDVQADWAKSGYVEVLTTSAHPLTTEIKNQITKEVAHLYPAAKKITLSEMHDPDIIGGVRVSLPDQQLDFSVEAKLNKLRGLQI